MKYYNKKMECMDRAELKKLQSERLAALVAYVYKNVAVYRAKMDAIGLLPSDIRSIDDISKLPFTTKQDLRDGYPFGMFASKKRDIVRIHASSGTTGKLTVVGYTKRDVDDWAECCARSLVCAGMDKNSVVHVAYGYGLFTGGLGLHYGAEKLGAMTVPASGGNTARQVQLLRDFRADALCCTPSYALYIADEMEKMGVKKEELNLKSGIFGAEPWSDNMRVEIENRLGIKAYDIYGLSEISGPGVAMDCAEQSGKHIFEDLFFPEIVDRDTLAPLPYGGEGELVFTTLNKQGLPLIRYRTRDICALTDEPCKCGRTHVRMSKVFGRTDDMLIIRGVNVFPSQIESVLMNNDQAVAPHYFITVDRVNMIDTIEIQIEVNEKSFSDEVKKMEALQKKLEHDLFTAIGINAVVKLVSPNTLPRSEGKAKRVTDLRKSNR
ncbi:MAG: phenylacetate--CoA ligase [Clostridiales bacterium]|jgi:phenylacetate-CoA ligase|nr:phenylacetate--CoA ligase [Clostridiales bacterium]